MLFEVKTEPIKAAKRLLKMKEKVVGYIF